MTTVLHRSTGMGHLLKLAVLTYIATVVSSSSEEKQVKTADINIAAIVVPVFTGALVVVANVIVFHVVKRKNGPKINRAATTPVRNDESGAQYQEQPLTGDPRVTSPASTTWYDSKEEVADKDRVNGVDDGANRSEDRDDVGDERNNDENEYSKPGTSRDDKRKEDEEGLGALKKTLKKKFDSVVKLMKRNNETGVDNQREVPDKNKSAWRDLKEKMNTINLQEPDEKLSMIHELQKTYNGSEHRDDDGEEMNNDENEHSMSGIPLDDKEKGDEEEPAASKDELKRMYDPLVKELERNNVKGVNNLREVPDKRKSAIQDPKEKGNNQSARARGKFEGDP